MVALYFLPAGMTLIRHDDKTMELAKTAVTEQAQGHGIGRMLAQAAIVRAKRMGADTLILETNDKLRTAIALYRSLGFTDVQDPLGRQSEYQRETFWMRLKLSKPMQEK